MTEPISNEILQFINALQLCIKSPILAFLTSRFGSDAPELIIAFEERPKNDEQWEYFLKLCPAYEWRKTDNFDRFVIINYPVLVTPVLINFLMITRLNKENILKIGDDDPRYREFVAKIFGFDSTRITSIPSLQEGIAIIFSRVEEMNLTIRQLAEKTGLSMVAISNFKAGKDIRLSNFLKIAQALGLKLKLE